jgi:hypothetical protein
LSQSESEESEPEVEFEDELVNIQRIFFFYLKFLVSLENVLLSVIVLIVLQILFRLSRESMLMILIIKNNQFTKKHMIVLFTSVY